MNTKSFYLIRNVVFTVALFFAIFSVFSCKNVTTDNPTSYTPIEKPNKPIQQQEITINGRISVETKNLAVAFPAEFSVMESRAIPDGSCLTADGYAQTSGFMENSASGRMALPTIDMTGLTNSVYYVKATATGAEPPRNGTVNATDRTFSISLPLGYTWTIELGLKTTQNSNDSAKLKGTYTFDHALTSSDAASPITIRIAPVISANGTGKIELPIDSSSYSFTVEATKEPVSGAWASSTFDNTNGIYTNSIKSGVYTVLIIFSDSAGIEVFSCEQTLNVFDNLTTNAWADGGSPSSPINADNQFVLTQELISDYARTNFYVASTTNNPAGSDTNGNGSSVAPFATVSRAISAIKATSPGKPCIIRLMSDITENINIDNTLTSSYATSLKIQGYRANRTITKGSGTPAQSSIICMNAQIPVTLQNLTVTGGNTGTASRGIYNGANLTLTDCTITGNGTSSDSEYGGGVFNDGTLGVSGRINITGNTRGTGTGAPASNVYLQSSNTPIAVVGALDEESEIGVTMQTEPTNGTPLAFTSGFATCNPDMSPSSIFTSDEHYAIVSGTGTNSGEAALAVTGGSFVSEVPGDNLLFSFYGDASLVSPPVTSFYAGYEKDIHLTTRTSASSNPISPSEITYTFKLKCGGNTIATPTPAAQGNAVKVTVPANVNSQALYPDSYTLQVKATYNGTTYDTNLMLEGKEWLLAGNPPPDGFVAVTGATITRAVGSGDATSSVFIAGRTVEIPNLLVSDHEVTQAEYQAVMGANPSEFNGSAGKEPAAGEVQANRPVECVSWYDALVYCNKKSIADGLTPCYTINGSTNPVNWGTVPTSNNATWNAATCNFNANGYRLPTEAEWEYIARGGNNGIPATQTIYSGTNSESNLTNYAWNSTNSGNKPHEVKKKNANSLGIYDMSGNVWEWCWDWYGSITSGTAATGATSGSSRDSRGGSWRHDASICSVAYRINGITPGSTYDDLGFRVVRTN